MNDPFQVATVADDVSFLGFLRRLCEKRNANLPASFFLCDATFDRDDTRIVLEIDGADVVFVCLTYPANMMNSVARGAILCAQEEGKPYGVYLQLPQLFCREEPDHLLKAARFVCIPDNTHQALVRKHFPNAIVRTVSDILLKRGALPTRQGKFRLPRRLIARAIAYAMKSV